MVNQASLTGESLPVRKAEGNYVYAGTVLEEGELTILVKEVGGSSRFEKIVTMIEESEKLKSSLEGKSRAFSRPVSAIYAGWNRIDLSVDPQHDKGTFGSDGGFFLCLKTCNADFRSFSHP